MSDLDAATPRVFLARHGETEWTITGQYTGITDIELTPEGIKQVTGTAAHLVGSGKLIDPDKVARVWVSPRKRALQTFRLLFGTEPCSPDSAAGNTSTFGAKVIVSEDIAEWDYGDYEGLTVGEIKARRKAKGLDHEKPYNIWRDGCEGGESMDQVTLRLDRLIGQIQDLQRPSLREGKPCDIVLVAHGLILRAFAKRWIRYALDASLPLIMSAGAVAILSYKNRNINEPGFYLGMALPSETDVNV